MLRVLFDHQIFSEQKYGGISRYFANLFYEINKRDDAKVKIGILYVKNHYVKKTTQPLNNKLGRLFLKKEHKRYHWNRKYSKYLLKIGKYDIFHATYYDDYSLKFNKKPIVITIHDMIHENHPEMFINAEEIINQKKKMMNSAAIIIAISAFTKKEIEKFYPQFKDKIRLVYHGLADESGSEHNESFNTPSHFILFVGERGKYKNFNLLVEAIVPFLSKNKHYKLIAAGGGAFRDDEIKYLKTHHVYDQCNQISASDQQLKSLYKNAKAFVYPSSEEGFGLPLLEAFRNDCPTICSNLSCLPEIGGNAVLYFNPDKHLELLNVIEKITSDTVLREQLIQSGKDRLQEFTIEKCVTKTLDIYKTLIKI